MTRPASGVAVPRFSAGGGGASLPFPLSAPESPTAFDDEFTTATLDPKWVVQNSMTASGATIEYNFDGTWLKLTVPSNSTQTARNLRVRQTMSGFASGTGFTMVARFSLTSIDSLADPQAIIGFSQNASYNTGDGVYLGITMNGTNRRVGAYTPGFTEATADLPNGASSVYFAVRRQPTTNIVDTWYSLDGISWRFLWGNSARAWNFAYLWLDLTGHGAGTTVNYVMCDFVRVNDTRFNIPSRS